MSSTYRMGKKKGDKQMKKKLIKVWEAKEVKGNSFFLASHGLLPDYQSSVLRGSDCLPLKSNLKASVREIVCNDGTSAEPEHVHTLYIRAAV